MTSLDGAGPAAAETANGARKVVAVARNKQPSSQTKPKRQEGKLANLAQRIRAEHQAVVRAANDVASHAVAAGRALNEARKHVPHGQWTDWLSRYCGEVIDRHARRYMALADAYDNQNGHTVSDLAGYSLRGLMRQLTPPQKHNSGHTVSATNPEHTQQKPKRISHRDLLALWLDLPVEERKPFLQCHRSPHDHGVHSRKLEAGHASGVGRMITLASNSTTTLAKFSGMLGFDHAGERAAAALKADQLVRRRTLLATALEHDSDLDRVPASRAGVLDIIERNDAGDGQLELFADHLPLISLPPCGRGRCKCLAIYELGATGPQLHCSKCDGVAPCYEGISARSGKSPPDDFRQTVETRKP